MRVRRRIRSGIRRAHGGRISQWRVGVSPSSPRAAPVDAIPANIRLLWRDVTANRRTTRAAFTLTTVSRISWSRPARPLKQNNIHSASCNDSTEVRVEGKTVPVHVLKACSKWERRRYSSTHSSPRHWMRVWSASRPGRFTPGKRWSGTH